MTFTEIFGDSPRVKLLDFLADHPDFDYTITEIHDFTGISRPTLYDLIGELGREGMIRETRLVGDSHFYRLNPANSKVAAMLEADFGRINQWLETQPAQVAHAPGTKVSPLASTGEFSATRMASKAQKMRRTGPLRKTASHRGSDPLRVVKAKKIERKSTRPLPSRQTRR